MNRRLEPLSALLPSVVAVLVARHQPRTENPMLNSAPYYWITCDGCDTNAQEWSDHSAWKDADTAFIEPHASGWTEQDDKHWCEACSSNGTSEQAPAVPSGEKTP